MIAEFKEYTMKKIALVTGANKGIGLEICKQLCKEDFKVILTARDNHRGLKAKESIEGDIHFYQLDVTQKTSILNLKHYLEKEFGKLDVLINNAAILLDEGISATNVKIESLRSTLETNLIGPFQLIQQLIPLLNKSREGRIINVSSGLGSLKYMSANYSGYSISKAGLNAMTVVFAQELKEKNILVNAMTPGWV